MAIKFVDQDPVGKPAKAEGARPNGAVTPEPPKTDTTSGGGEAKAEPKKRGRKKAFG